MEWNPPAGSSPTPEELTAYVGTKADLYRARFARFTRLGDPRFE